MVHNKTGLPSMKMLIFVDGSCFIDMYVLLRRLVESEFRMLS